MALKPTNPNRTPPRSTIAGRDAAAAFSPAPNGTIGLPRERADGVDQCLFAVVAGMVVRQRQRVEPCTAQRSEQLRAATERVTTLGRFTAGGEGALQVADREVGPTQHPRHRRQRRSRVRDAAAEHHVTHDEEVARAGVVADRVHPTDPRGHHRRPHGIERYDGQGARVTFDGARCARRAGRPRTTRSPCQRVTRPEVSRTGLRASEVELRTGRVPDHHQRLGRCGGPTATACRGRRIRRLRPEPARSPPAGESAHPASIAAAAASARSRSRHTPTLRRTG